MGDALQTRGGEKALPCSSARSVSLKGVTGDQVYGTYPVAGSCSWEKGKASEDPSTLCTARAHIPVPLVSYAS